jgi:glycogen operon protein
VDTSQAVLPTPGNGARVKGGDALWLTDRSLMVLQRPA